MAAATAFDVTINQIIERSENPRVEIIPPMANCAIIKPEIPLRAIEAT